MLQQRARKSLSAGMFAARSLALDTSYRPQRDGTCLREMPVMLMLAWWPRRRSCITAVT
jgi:hypothetical protein